MAFPNLPPDLQAMFALINDRLSKLETGPNQAMYTAEEAGAQATISLQAAIEANAAAAQATYEAGIAVQSANGKSTTHYSTSSPTGTGNNGDIWFQVNGSTGVVEYQYIYNNGSWNNSPVANTVIANLDAGKITAGTITGIAYNNGSGTFSVSPAGVLVATSATITGNITATSGSFTGAVTATSGSFTGSVTANSGTIGGFSIGSNFIGNPSTSYGMNSSNGYATFAIVGVTGLISSGSIFANGSGSNVVAGGSISSGTSITSGTTMTATGELYASYGATNTVTNTANTWMSTSGQVRRSTASSERYKTDIVDLTTIDELNPQKLYDLPVRAFRYKEGSLADTDDRYQMLIPGFIAEEVDAIYPIAADYEDGPESWNDRILIPGLLALIQEQNERIKALEAKN